MIRRQQDLGHAPSPGSAAAAPFGQPQRKSGQGIVSDLAEPPADRPELWRWQGRTLTGRDGISLEEAASFVEVYRPPGSLARPFPDEFCTEMNVEHPQRGLVFEQCGRLG